MIRPRLYGQLVGMMRRIARGKGDAITLCDGEARLVSFRGFGTVTEIVEDPTPIVADIRPLLDGDAHVPFPDPVLVVNRKARPALPVLDDFGRQRNEEPGVRFVVPGPYTDSVDIGGRIWWDTFAEAVGAARRGQSATTSTDGHIPRAFVHLRMSSSYAPFDGVSSGIDQPLLTWEVFPDRVVMVLEGSLTDQGKKDALEVKTPREGWA